MGCGNSRLPLDDDIYDKYPDYRKDNSLKTYTGYLKQECQPFEYIIITNQESYNNFANLIEIDEKSICRLYPTIDFGKKDVIVIRGANILKIVKVNNQYQITYADKQMEENAYCAVIFNFYSERPNGLTFENEKPFEIATRR
jgi:hypothetical protein